MPAIFLVLVVLALGGVALRSRQLPVAAVHAAVTAIPLIGTPGPSTPDATPGAAPDGTLAPLGAKIAALTAPLQGSYGVWMEDLATGGTTGQNAGHQYVAASVIKFCLLVALYEESSQGRISLEEKLTTTPENIQDYGTGSIRYDPVGTSYTLADLAQRAAKQSDNTAAYLIKERLGEDYIQRRVQAWGLTGTSIAGDRTTPRDIGTLFAAIARRQILSGPSALGLLGLLTDTDFEDRLPALLPSYALVAHKIGTETHGVLNDAGIVVLPTRTYAIAILTSDANPDQAIPAEQQLSAAAYAFEAALP